MSSDPEPQQKDPRGDALSVSGALALAKRQLEQIYITVIGEVSELSSNASYKAVYFTIKDESAALPCMMWTNKYRSSGVELQVGALVQIRGRFSLYAAKGRMNFSVDAIALAGEGDLRLRVANLAKKLEAEGLMGSHRKKPIPSMPLRIGLVTSPNGAAVYDVLRTLRRRFPLAQVVLCGVKVEGADAPAAMMEALARLDASDVDVILLVRGGGSFEDLMPFNDEGLARFIASMDTPVVTGIGHEPDTSIADMVSDLRASTPTAAAEAISPNSTDLCASLDSAATRMCAALSERLRALGSRLALLRARPALADPLRMILEQAQTLDAMAGRLQSAIPRSIERMGVLVSQARLRLQVRGQSMAQAQAHRLTRLDGHLRSLPTQLIVKPREDMRLAATALSNLSPLAILGRGYAYAFRADGSIIKSVDQVGARDPFMVRVSDGIIDCEAVTTRGLEE